MQFESWPRIVIGELRAAEHSCMQCTRLSSYSFDDVGDSAAQTRSDFACVMSEVHRSDKVIPCAPF